MDLIGQTQGLHILTIENQNFILFIQMQVLHKAVPLFISVGRIYLKYKTKRSLMQDLLHNLVRWELKLCQLSGSMTQ